METAVGDYPQMNAHHNHGLWKHLGRGGSKNVGSKGWGGCFEMLPSGNDMAFAHENSQQ